jgi:hypothetical protein
MTNLNNPQSIIETLSKDPVHMAKIYSTIKSNEKDFNSYFDGTMYLDEDLEGQPFLAFLASSVFKWCGCAVGHEGRLLGLYELMSLIESRKYEEIDSQTYFKMIKEKFGSDNNFCIIMDFFDQFNLFDHGGSVYGSWLSNDGYIVYEHLKAWVENRK